MFQDVAGIWKVLVREDFLCTKWRLMRRTFVGVSLLAMAVCQSATI
jgi:hypothetical protein